MLGVSTSHAAALPLERAHLRRRVLSARGASLPAPFVQDLDSHEMNAYREEYRKFRDLSQPRRSGVADDVRACNDAAVPPPAAAVGAVPEGPPLIPACCSMPALTRYTSMPTQPSTPSGAMSPVLPPSWAARPPPPADLSPAAVRLAVARAMAPVVLRTQPTPAGAFGLDKVQEMTAAAAAAKAATPVPAAPRVSDALLREAFASCLATSAEAEEGSPLKLIAYDAADCPTVRNAGPWKARLDARRNKKPNPQAAALAADPSTDPNASVAVCQEVDPAKFNFTKVHPREVLATLELAGRSYKVLPNKFPVVGRHLLLVDGALAPQRLTLHALEAVASLQAAAPSFAASFNSWGAAASVNHLHIHLTDEELPLDRFPIVDAPEGSSDEARLEGYPAQHAGFATTCKESLARLAALLAACHRTDTPYNVAFSRKGFAFVFCRTKAQHEGTWALYGERLGGFEMCGVFTAYHEGTYANLTQDKIAGMLARAVVPPPKC